MNRRLELTRARIVALIIGVPLTLAAISAFALHTLGDLAAGSYPVRFDLPAQGRAVTVSVDAGDLRVSAATGLVSTDLTATDRSGDITLRFARVPDHVDVTTSLGDITLVLPPGAVYRIDASAPLGSSTIRVPTSPRSTHVLTVTDTSGSITITN